MRYLIAHPTVVLGLVGQHLWLTAASLAVAAGIALPLGVLAARRPRFRGPLLGVLGVIYTIPSLALFVLLIPVMGLGFAPAVTALAAYAQVILVRNITVGLLGVDPAAVEAARGMGMTSWQRLWRVELPLALPVIVAGTRVAILTTIGIGTIAAFINAGGLGVLLFAGVAQSHPDKITAGALGSSGLALAANWALRKVELRSARAAQGEGW
ncbi:MAG: ABC transporter permease [Armatimonadota bacterium]|nr:ABC transporter permease [Armatimonadota bacterium]